MFPSAPAVLVCERAAAQGAKGISELEGVVETALLTLLSPH